MEAAPWDSCVDSKEETIECFIVRLAVISFGSFSCEEAGVAGSQDTRVASVAFVSRSSTGLVTDTSPRSLRRKANQSIITCNATQNRAHEEHRRMHIKR